MPGSEWLDLLTIGDQLFDYLYHNFHSLFDDQHNIKHFDIHPASVTMMRYCDSICEQYVPKVHDAIIPWIREEYSSGRLTNKNLWKPFRIPYLYTSMYYGYRKLFMFDKYYFQLTLVSDGDTVDGTDTQWICFEVALYGWKDEGVDTLQPLNKVSVLEDMMMPEYDWIRK